MSNVITALESSRSTTTQDFSLICATLSTFPVSLGRGLSRTLSLSLEHCCSDIHVFCQDRTGVAKAGLLLPRSRDFAEVAALSRDRAAPEIAVD
jgi:hypothetical protein